jgi:hypothetical protein
LEEQSRLLQREKDRTRRLALQLAETTTEVGLLYDQSALLMGMVEQHQQQHHSDANRYEPERLIDTSTSDQETKLRVRYASMGDGDALVSCFMFHFFIKDNTLKRLVEVQVRSEATVCLRRD